MSFRHHGDTALRQQQPGSKPCDAGTNYDDISIVGPDPDHHSAPRRTPASDC
jgi:hypothetical protein